MPITHTKSPCCQGIIYRFGSRRRQCAICRKTWRIRKKRRGRKSHYWVDSSLVIDYLRGRRTSMAWLAQNRLWSSQRLQYHMQRSLDSLLKQEIKEHLPSSGKLVAIADGLVQRFKGTFMVLYLIFLKPINDSRAFIMPPVLIAGSESREGWQMAFSRLPDTWKSRISALICDGRIGLLSLARSHDWLVQRCQAHLLRRVQQYLSSRPLTRHHQTGPRVRHLVETILNYPRDPSFAAASLRAMAKETNSRGLQKTLSGFLKHRNQYRTYLLHPRLHLPTTTNAVESFNGMIREMLRRTRGFRSPRAFLRWVTALARLKKTMTCHDNFQPN